MRMCGERAAHASPLVQACTGRRVAVFATSPAGVARPFEFRLKFRRYVFEFQFVYHVVYIGSSASSL